MNILLRFDGCEDRTKQPGEQLGEKDNKMHDKDKLRQDFAQFIKLGLIGISNVLISYIFYLLVIKLQGHYAIANIVGYVASICNAFFWNNGWVFKEGNGKKRKLLQAFGKMLCSYAGTGIVLNSILLWVWIEGIGVAPGIAPAINILITTPLNFLLNKLWVFKTEK